MMAYAGKAPWGTVLAIVGIGAVAIANASESQSWANLNAWVGRYPTNGDSRPNQWLVHSEPIRHLLSKTLSEADLATIDSYTVESLIEEADGFLVVQKCMPHNCPNAHVMLVIDPIKERVWIAFYRKTAAVTSTRWYGPEDHLILPSGILEEFRAGHTPK